MIKEDDQSSMLHVATFLQFQAFKVSDTACFAVSFPITFPSVAIIEKGDYLKKNIGEFYNPNCIGVKILLFIN